MGKLYVLFHLFNKITHLFIISLKKGKVVIITAGRFAGCKAVVVDVLEEGTDVIKFLFKTNVNLFIRKPNSPMLWSPVSAVTQKELARK
jgi:hypothetical protein